MATSVEQLADLVELNYEATTTYSVEGFTRIFEKWYGPLDTFEVARNVPLVPNMNVLVSEDHVVACVGGVRDNAMRFAAYGGWTNRPDIAASHGFNAFAWGLALQWLFPRIQPYIQGARKITLVGHSMGGMVCPAVNYLMDSTGEGRAELILTTGSPRALAAGFDGYYVAGEYWRFMNPADPICFFPPRFSEAPYVMILSMGAAVPISAVSLWTTFTAPDDNSPAALWPLFHHSPGGIVVFDNGMSVAAQLPVYNGLRELSGVNGAAAFQVSEDASQHDLSSYVSSVRFWATVASLSDKTLEELEGGSVGGAEWDVEPGFILPINPEGFYVLPLEGGVLVATNPIQTGTMPVANGGREGCLYLRGNLVACFPNRSRANTAARKLNQFLSRLPSATQVSVGGLTAGMSQYLGEAAVGGGVDKKPVRVVA